MAAKLWSVASSNAFSSTLNGSIGSSDTSITLNSVSTLQAPGILVIDRTDGAGNATPTSREYISFTGISGNQVTGVTRGVAGSTAQLHNTGAQVEECWSVTHTNDLVSFLQAEHDSTGKHVIGTATINYTETKNLAVTSTASFADFRVGTFAGVSQASLAFLNIGVLLSASGASLQALPLHPVFRVGGVVSLATTSVGPPIPIPNPSDVQWISATLRSPVSGSSLVLDIKKNFTSIIASSNVLSILGGGTFVSTASIATKHFNQNDMLTLDISNGGGTASDLTVVTRLQ